MIKIALIDDHVILRKSLAALLGIMPPFKVIFQAGNGRELIDYLQINSHPDIVLADIAMPIMDGAETTRWLKDHHPAIKVIGLSMHSHEAVVTRMIKNGARAYLLKDSEPDELSIALQEVYTTGYYYNQWHKLANAQNIFTNKYPKHLLNEQELLFLRCSCTEKSLKEIAAEMCVSPRTVDGYRDALFRKLEVSSRVGIVMYALKNEIVIL